MNYGLIPGMKTEEAVSLFDNSVAKLAAALGISVQAVYKWGEDVPPLRVYQIRDLLPVREAASEITGVPVYSLHPDVFAAGKVAA